MHMLRDLLAKQVSLPPSRAADDTIIEQVAELVISGRLHLHAKKMELYAVGVAASPDDQSVADLNKKRQPAEHASPPPATAPNCPTVEIEINNTPTTNDDLVGLRCDHPVHHSNVNCRIRATGAGTIRTLVLTNPDGRLRFPGSGDTTKDITLPSDGSWVPFQISGKLPSNAIGDAVIEAHCETATGDLKGSKPVTVFWFDNAHIKLTRGGNYRLIGASYSTTGGPAVSFSASGTIKPAGVDCSAPQVKHLRIGIMQESSNFQITYTWDTPVLHPSAPPGTNISVPTQMRQTTQYAATVHQPVNDGLTAAQEPPSGAYPLYSMNALMHPMGCPSGAHATSSDTPGQGAPARFSQLFGGVNVIWSRLVNTTRTENFRTFCVVFNTDTKQYCALRQATWSINVDSAGAAASQHANVTADGRATVDPATGVQANNAANTTVTAKVGVAVTPLSKP